MTPFDEPPIRPAHVDPAAWLALGWSLAGLGAVAIKSVWADLS